MITMADNLDDTIRQNAQGPAKVSGDAGSVESQPLQDQIAVAIENALTLERIRQTSHELDSLRKLGVAMGSVKSIDALLGIGHVVTVIARIAERVRVRVFLAGIGAYFVYELHELY